MSDDSDKHLPVPSGPLESSSPYRAAARVARGVLQVAGAVPFIGGIFGAIAGAWSERDQDKVNRFFDTWLRMIQDEIGEKEETVIEIMARLDLQDEKVAERVESPEYQSLLKKTFREWAGAESEAKRVLLRNILSNAAASTISSDDVVRLFVEWISVYSELHFLVIGAIYNENGISRGGVWRKLRRDPVREDSADADLYRLLFHDLSVGRIVRQHREVDYEGNFIKKTPQKTPRGDGSKTMKSAFDEEELYELTELGKQFVHYAMTDLPPKISFEMPKRDP